jgi:NADPH-dependent 2,4-dienoyl-CoA reductase/sulfur reductase-like enzyme
LTVAVVGAGMAGLRTCESLRQNGYAEAIVLIGAEKHPPYTRPPLSKEVLRSEADVTSATLRTADELTALEVDVRLGRTATGLDVDGHRVLLDDGSRVDFDALVIATGSAPRRLPGAAFEHAHVLRTVDDCLDLRAKLVDGATVSIVGAGFIGLEVAASARARGCDVTVIDLLPEPLARVLPAEVGRVVRRLHADNGVTFQLGATVDAGTRLDADVVVVGIGAAPETSWLDSSGLTVDDGVVCDASLRAAPGIWAVGDVARWSDTDGRSLRVEHWTNATEQPHHVARDIVSGSSTPFETVPYFWSDQYDAKLQCLGFGGAGDEVAVVRGALDEPKWVALVRSDDRLGGVVGLRSPGPVMRLKPLLAARASWQDALAAVGERAGGYRAAAASIDG